MVDFSPPAAQRVLVLSPHPDDESLGCSGTILLYTGKGTEVYLGVISMGEKLESAQENIGDIRKSEAIATAALLGIKETIFLEFPDEEINMHQEEIKGRLSEIIKDIKPEIIFVPSPLDPHPDHKAVSEITLQIMADFPGTRLAFYEVYHPIRFNILVDISSVINKKKEAIFTYEKSLLDMPELFWYAIKGLNAFRSLVYRREGMYEAFYMINTPMSRNSIMRWATFDYPDYTFKDAAEVFLSQVKVADALIFELQNVHAALDFNDKELSALKGALDEKEKRLLELEKEKKFSDLMKGSFAWKLATRFYEFRDKVLPSGTARRNLYNKAIERLKRMA